MKRIIKVGGRPQGDSTLPALIAGAAMGQPGTTIVVHGGGDELSALQRTMGSVPEFIDGRRVTTTADIELVRMALSGAANKRLVAGLTTEGIRAVGLSGEDGSLMTARPVDHQRMGLVGIPEGVNFGLLELLMDEGYLPVISPVSRSSNPAVGPALNVNGDDAAAAIAVAVRADELLFISDVEAVSCDGVPLGHLSADAPVALLSHPSVTGGMRAKLQAALFALDGGVERVRISDLKAIGDPSRGTTFTRTGVLT